MLRPSKVVETKKKIKKMFLVRKFCEIRNQCAQFKIKQSKNRKYINYMLYELDSN